MTTVDSWPKTLPMLSVGSWNSTTETHLTDNSAHPAYPAYSDAWSGLVSTSPVIVLFLLLQGMKISNILIQIPMLGVWWDMHVSHWPKDFWKNSYVWPVWNLQVCTRIEKSRNFGFVICLVNVSCSSYVNNKPWILNLPIFFVIFFGLFL